MQKGERRYISSFLFRTGPISEFRMTKEESLERPFHLGMHSRATSSDVHSHVFSAHVQAPGSALNSSVCLNMEGGNTGAERRPIDGHVRPAACQVSCRYSVLTPSVLASFASSDLLQEATDQCVFFLSR